jgi:hypothetical protein
MIVCKVFYPDMNLENAYIFCTVQTAAGIKGLEYLKYILSFRVLLGVSLQCLVLKRLYYYFKSIPVQPKADKQYLVLVFLESRTLQDRKFESLG